MTPTNNGPQQRVAHDASDLRAALDGNRDAFGRVISRYQGLIHSYFRGRPGLAPYAGDLTQEVFLLAYRSLHSLRGEEKLLSWLFTIARNLGHESMRKQDQQNKALVFLGQSREGQNKHKENMDESAEEMNRAIAELPESQALALTLRYGEKMGYAEIAGTMKISEDSVRGLLYRACEALRRKLGGTGRRTD